MTRRSRPDGDRLVDRVASLCARVQEPLDLLQQVAVVVRPAIPYDVGAWLLVDPDTFLINGVFEEQVPREAQLRLMELELAADEDPNKFVDLGRARVPAASLGEATGGRLDRCLRWSRVYQPEGYGDEARAVFRTGPVTWGAVCLTRRATEPWFRGREIRLLARLSAHVAHGIRTGLLLNEYRADADPTAAPGLVVLDSAGRVESTSPRALEWLGPVQEGNLDGSIVVHQVAARARALADGAVAGPPAMARARAPTGE